MSLDHAWLKGVPMELRPRYFPKPPLRFKDIDIYIPLDAIENDYDFQEERRVLIECKMFEEEKERERLARAEELRIRELADAQERLRLEEQERLEREEAVAAGIAALAAAAAQEAEEEEKQQRLQLLHSNQLLQQESDQLEATSSDSEPPSEISSKTDLNLDSSAPPLSAVPSSLDTSVASLAAGEDTEPVARSSSSHHDSPTSEENSLSSSQSQLSQAVPSSLLPHSSSPPEVGTTSREATAPATVMSPPLPVPPQAQAPYPLMNGYHYMPHAMYHHQQPQYYNYYMPPPQQQYSQVAPSVMYQPQIPPQPPYPTQPAPGPARGVVSPPVPAPQPPSQPPPQTASAPAVAPVVQTPTSSSSSAGVTPSGPPESNSTASGTSSPTGDSSEKSSVGGGPPANVSTSSSASAIVSPVSASVNPNTKVDLKDLSIFEADMANPFDNVELKSINDMEVLASVLKNHGGGPEASSQSRSGSTGSTPSSFVATVTPGSNGAPFYHQPTPIYPPSSQPQPPQQCPYPTWNPSQNGYTSSSTNIAPPPPPTSHIPSPTQSIDPPTSSTSSAPPTSTSPSVTAANSFTKLTFPFLTSMEASSSRYPRSAPSAPISTPHPSQDDLASQNPFLSRYVQNNSPLQRHQYWPSSHLPPPATQQPQHGPPYTSAPIPNGLGGGAGPLVHHAHLHPPGTHQGPSSAPQQQQAVAGTQHVMR